MKYDDMPTAAQREGDSMKMVEAILRLRRIGVDARRPANNPHQIKVRPDLSYYPTTGRIVADGAHSCAQRGLNALIELLSSPLEI